MPVGDDEIQVNSYDRKVNKQIMKQIATLTAKVNTYEAEINPLKADLDTMRKIKWCVDVATGAVNPDGEERESITEKLKRNKAKADIINAQRPKKSPTRGELER